MRLTPEPFCIFCDYYIKHSKELQNLQRLRILSRRGRSRVFRSINSIHVHVHERKVFICSSPESRLSFGHKPGSFEQFVDFFFHIQPKISGVFTSGYGQYFDYLTVNWFLWDYPCISYIPNYHLNNVCITAMILYYHERHLNVIHVFPGILARYNVKHCPSILPPSIFHEVTLDLTQQECMTGTMAHHSINTLKFELSPYFSAAFSFASTLERGSRLVSSLKKMNVVMKMKSGYYVYNRSRSMLDMVEKMFNCGVRLNTFGVELIELGCAPISHNYVDWMYQDLIGELQRISSANIKTTFDVKLRVKLHQAWTLKQVAQAHLRFFDPGATLARIQAQCEKKEIRFTHRVGCFTLRFHIEHLNNALPYKK